jgi:hypothetical protein
MNRQWTAKEALRRMHTPMGQESAYSAKQFPLLQAASTEELLTALLAVVPAEVAEEALARHLYTHTSTNTSSRDDLDEMIEQDFAQCPDVEKRTLKTQPIITEDGKVRRPQGRPPKRVAPVLVKNEQEQEQALQRLKDERHPRQQHDPIRDTVMRAEAKARKASGNGYTQMTWKEEDLMHISPSVREFIAGEPDLFADDEENTSPSMATFFQRKTV